MADWTTISSLATAGGTLVLAAATFSAVRSSNRSARVAERALLAGLRPVLVPSRLGDPEEKVLFQDLRWFRLAGGRAVAEQNDGMVFLIIGVRNVGTGLAVPRGWRVEHPGRRHRLLAGRDPRHERSRPRRDRRGHHEPREPHGQHALRRRRGRPARHHQVCRHPRRRLRLADVGVAALEPRPRRPALADPVSHVRCRPRRSDGPSAGTRARRRRDARDGSRARGRR